MNKDTLKKQLIALGADTLAELLMAEADDNAALRKQLDLAVIKTNPQKLAKKLSQQINGIKRANRFIEWRQAQTFVRDLYKITTAIEQDLLPQDARLAAELIEAMVALDKHLCERMDDSNGALGGFFHSLIILWGEAWHQMAHKDSALLIEKVLYHLHHDDYGVKAGLIQAMKKPLGESGLEALEAQVIKEQHRLERYVLSKTLEEIADARGDVDKYIETVKKQTPLRISTVCQIARRLIDKWRCEEAIQWLLHEPDDISVSELQCNLDQVTVAEIRRFDLLLQAYDAESLLDEAQALRWRLFELTLDAHYYQGLIRHQSADEVATLSARAMQWVLHQYEGSPSQILGFLTTIQELEAAAHVVMTRYEALDERDYHCFRPLSKTLAQAGFNLSACLLRRKLIDGILNKALSKYYRYAVSDLNIATRLAQSIQDWHGFPDQTHYVTALRERHGRKKAFWSQLESKG